MILVYELNFNVLKFQIFLSQLHLQFNSFLILLIITQNPFSLQLDVKISQN